MFVQFETTIKGNRWFQCGPKDQTLVQTLTFPFEIETCLVCGWRRDYREGIRYTRAKIARWCKPTWVCVDDGRICFRIPFLLL